MKKLSKILVLVLAVCMMMHVNVGIFAENGEKSEAETDVNTFDVAAKSAVLMEAKTGKILYSKNENDKLPPASVTKIMTLLLVAEAIDSSLLLPDEMLSVSSYAASMGGSQVFLKEGELISVLELIKSTVIASANDAAVLLAERIAGSESSFVDMMNKRAKELGMENTYFENVTGLDDTTEKHMTSAKDIAIMSRELIKHDEIMKYSSLWQDSIRGGEFTLTNTNRLVRFYDGCTGLKTGSTDKAGFCISATAQRDDMHLIAVIMGSESRDIRNAEARKLLDFGFSKYKLYRSEEQALENVPVRFGTVDTVKLYESEFCDVIPAKDISKVEKIYTLPENVSAPIKAGESLGKVEYMVDGSKIGEADIYSLFDIEKIDFLSLYKRFILAAIQK